MTAGSRSISSNIACLMASRKVTCVPFTARPFGPAPFVLAMAISAPFWKRSRSQPSLFSWEPPSQAFSPFDFWPSLIQYHSPPHLPQAAYHRNQPPHPHHPHPSPFQPPKPSHQPHPPP